ncbi:hypothetical protein JST99_00940 [Candidatus Dependentiae bacterium]|nr:hypothetical protein [Candidatus Dependentiae bacterium]
MVNPREGILIMNSIGRTFLVGLFLVVVAMRSIHSIEQIPSKTDSFYIIWLPGLYGGHAEQMSLVTTQNYAMYDVIKPAADADLGQERCIGDLERQLHNDQTFQKANKVIVIGTSQGAATWLNEIARMTLAQQDHIAAIILEAPLADANEAIMQSALKKPGVAYLPLVRFWSPWIAKLYHPFYNPYGLQAITSVKQIAHRIPVIILHNKKDRRISVNSARRLVREFLTQRRSMLNNLYYIETDIVAQRGDSHTDFLREDAQAQAAFHAICKKLGLPYDKEQAERLQDQDLKNFQPLVEQLDTAIDQSSWVSTMVRNVVDGVTLAVIAALLYMFISKRLKR